MRDSLDEALLRQMEKSILLDTVYDERRISEEAMQALLRERCVEALCAIRRVLDEDTQDPECFGKIEEIVKIYEAIGADGGASHAFNYHSQKILTTRVSRMRLKLLRRSECRRRRQT